MKRIFALILTMTVLMNVVGCMLPSDKNKEETLGNNPSVSHYPVTVVDQAGREVVIEKEPQKLVSCYYITTSLLMALDLDEKMVGIEDNPDYRPIYGLSAPKLLELPWVGTAKVLDLEACAALEPDLVILPMRLKDSVQTLEKLGIDVLLVNPESQELLVEMIQLVAAATNTEENAEELQNFLDSKKRYLQDTLGSVADAPSVYLSGNSNFLSTAGRAMYQSDLIRLAGGRNVAENIEDTYWAEIDYEQLLTWNPDYIILASSAKYSVQDVLENPNLKECSAVKNGNVYQFPNETEAWDSPVPGSILGAIWLGNILHPDKISDTECATLMDEYYETFYEFTYSKN